MLAKEPVAVLLNANARRFSRHVVRQVGRVVPERDIFVSRTPEEARQAAREVLSRGYPTVCTGGGDGTLMQFVTSAHELGTGTPDIGVLKLGTGNAIASFIGAGPIDEDLRKMRAGLAPMRAALPLLAVEGRLCHFAGLGVDAAIINDFHETQSRWLSGEMRYLASVVSRSIPRQLTTRRKRPVVRVINRGRPAYRCGPNGELLGEPIPAGEVLFEGPMTLVGASTTPFYGYGMRIYPFAGAQPGRVQLRVASSGVFEILSKLPALWRGTHRSETIHDSRVDAAELQFSRPAPFQIAGDPHGYRERVMLSVSEHAARLVDLRPPVLLPLGVPAIRAA